MLIEVVTPRYAAFVGGTCVEMGNDLDALLTVVEKDASGTGEDVVIWRDGRTVAALLQADGSVLVLEGEQAGRRRPASLPPPAKDDYDARLKAIFRPSQTRRS